MPSFLCLMGNTPSVENKAMVRTSLFIFGNSYMFVHIYLLNFQAMLMFWIPKNAIYENIVSKCKLPITSSLTLFFHFFCNDFWFLRLYTISKLIEYSIHMMLIFKHLKMIWSNIFDQILIKCSNYIYFNLFYV